jgi:hypothetical protein
LSSYKGILQADGYAGFNQLYEKGEIVEAACWAHYLESGGIRSKRSGPLVRGPLVAEHSG